MLSCTLKIWNVAPLLTAPAVALPTQKRLLQAARVEFAAWQNQLPRQMSKVDDLLAQARERLLVSSEPRLLAFAAR